MFRGSFDSPQSLPQIGGCTALLLDGAGVSEPGRNSDPVSSFLPAYYCAMNLVKGTTTLTSLYSRLHQRQPHGLSYDPAAKQSQHVLTEKLKVLQRGIFPLAYEATTGQLLPGPGVTTVSMRDIYPFLPDVSAEYRLATHQRRQGNKGRPRQHLTTILTTICGPIRHGQRQPANVRWYATQGRYPMERGCGRMPKGAGGQGCAGLKTAIPARVSWVRIPLPPPLPAHNGLPHSIPFMQCLP